MFSKQNKTPPKPTAVSAPAPAPAPSAPEQPKARPKVASLISDGITIEGGVVGDGELQIDGVVRGDVRVGRLTVGDTGHIEGSVYAEAVEIRGRVIGSVTAKQVRLYGTAYIDGDITHEQLAMETGAFFQGRSLKFQRPAAPAQQSQAPHAPQAPMQSQGLGIPPKVG
ncbi:CcmA Integral membrane protein CcmA involved in cell shape determination [Caulobacteraceae bacterium]|jgi:cytoskeletal protein CcmA (bactofilin family)